MTTTPVSLSEPARRTEILMETEVIVLGGGPAGIAAAWAAARQGCKTLLVERYGFLGGMGTAAGVTNFCGLHGKVQGEIRRLVHGVADELLGRIDALGGLNPPHEIFGRTQAQAYDMSAYKCAADELVLGAGAQLLFHAAAAGVVMRDANNIDALLVETRSGRRALRGRMFIDASGDGDLAHWAGAPWEKGDAQGHMLYPTLMFRLNDVDAERARRSLPEIQRLMDEAAAEGSHRFPRRGVIIRPQKHPSEWRANVTQVSTATGDAVDGTDALQLSAGEIEGRRQIRDYARFLRERVPGFERSYVLDIAPQLGIRETRRVTGHTVLQAADVLGCASFPDSIGVNAWPLERHVAGDVDWQWPPADARGYNHLPYRMLLPQRVDNLLVAGRCASMSAEAQSAARVSGACFVMGQAAGTAAHLALAAGVAAADVPVGQLQARLERDGAWLGRD